MAEIRYTLVISEEALSQLRSLQKGARRVIGGKLERLEANMAGDVKKLRTSENKYRLRIGPWRVLFRLAGRQIQVYAVKDRKEAYE